jgi:membrane protease YdiL (CAAX protease family)
VWLAIVISALLFGVGHLPYASVVVPALNGVGVVFIVLANTVFGIVFGYLYWRRGLESAMMAHGVAHLVAYLLMAMI